MDVARRLAALRDDPDVIREEAVERRETAEGTQEAHRVQQAELDAEPLDVKGEE
jgi:hypothetical protein